MSIARHAVRLDFGLAWIGANAVGYAIAIAAWEAVSQPIWLALSGFLGGSVTLAMYGAAVGLGASLVQTLALRLRGTRAGLWIAASTLGYALGFVVAAWVGLVMSRNSATDLVVAMVTSGNRTAGVLLRETAVNIPFGLVIGASVGVARWLVLRGSSPVATRWIPVSAVAFTLGFGMAVGLIQFVPAVRAAVFGALFGAYAGALTALIEWLWLRRQSDVWGLPGPPIKS